MKSYQTTTNKILIQSPVTRPPVDASAEAVRYRLSGCDAVTLHPLLFLPEEDRTELGSGVADDPNFGNFDLFSTQLNRVASRLIIFSTTFGRSEHGVFRKSFSLGTRRSERRLNVAVTRARKTIVIITSMRPVGREYADRKRNFAGRCSGESAARCVQCSPRG